MLIHEVSKFTDTVGVYFAAQNIRFIKTAFLISQKHPVNFCLRGAFVILRKGETMSFV